MKKIKITLGISLSLLSLLILTHCSRKQTSENKISISAPEQQLAERFLNLHNLVEPEYLDPALSTGMYEYQIGMALFEGLLTADPKGPNAIPGVAERWEISPDGKVYTFYLRKNATWSDGNKVTVNDFIYSWERVLNPVTGAKYAFILYYIKNAKPYNIGTLKDAKQLGLKALDDYTLQVTLEGPTPFFLEVLPHHTYMPTPKWAIEKHGSQWTRPENIVTNGPFLLKSWISQKVIEAVKNPNYWDQANVKLPGIRFYPIDDKETALKMYEAGELDTVWEIPDAKIPSLMERPDFSASPYLATYFFRLNITKPPLDNVKVRQALALAIDRKILCEQYLQKTQIPSSSMVPSGLKNYTPAPGLEFNPEKAKQLLKEAGYTNPVTFPTLTIHYNTDPRHKLVAQVVQQMWKQNLGINVQLFNEEWKSYLKTQRSMNYQISRSGWVGDYPDPNTFLDMFTSASPLNMTGWQNAPFDNLITLAGKTLDQTVRLNSLKEAEVLLLNEAPVIPIWTQKKSMLIHPYVKGLIPNVLDRYPPKWVSLEGNSSATNTVSN